MLILDYSNISFQKYFDKKVITQNVFYDVCNHKVFHLEILFDPFLYSYGV